MTTGKTIALIFVGKVMSLLFKMLSRSLPPIPVPVSKIRTSGNSFCGPVVRTLHFPCQDPGSVSGGGAKILQVKWLGGKKKCSFDD